MSAEMFATLVVARLREAVGITLEERHGLEFKLRVGEESRTWHLDSYYQHYRAEPAELTPIVQQFIENVTTGVPEAAAPDSFEQVAPKLMPLLMSSGEWQRKREAGIRTVVRPLVQDLGIALVVDEPGSITFVQLDAIPRWGVDMASLFETAMGNLARRATEVSVSQIGENEAVLLIDRAMDGYAATRAVLPSRLEDWSRRVPGELVLGLPTRDFLIGFSRAHPHLDALREQVAKDAQTNEHGLMPELLVYRNGELQILEESVGR